MRGLQEMVARGAYCVDVITQTSAVKQALSQVEDILLEGHLGTCALAQIRRGDEAKAVQEIIKVYKLKRK
jgi:DNA-binding FrmR family transcriptional regulator